MTRKIRDIVLISAFMTVVLSCGVTGGPSLITTAPTGGGGGGGGGGMTPLSLQLGAVTKATGGDNTGSDSCRAVATDAQGNIYCAGNTNGALGEGNGGGGMNDAFVMKINSSGQLQWLTHFGAVTQGPGGDTSQPDQCFGVAVDSSGNVYCAGQTSESLGEANAGGSVDAFIMKLNSSGQIVWITQFGSVTTAPGGNNSNSDQCNAVTVDSADNVYCAGSTTSSMGEAKASGSDAFVVKLNSSGALQWLTQMGDVTRVPGRNNSWDQNCYGVAVDSSGNVYCAGNTEGSMAEVHGGGIGDAFVLKLNSSGVLQWVTQLGNVTRAPGGSNAGRDSCQAVAVDGSNNVYCAGITEGAMGEANGGGQDGFILKLDSAGALQWLTQLGSVTKASGGSNSGNEQCFGLAVDSAGNSFCVGSTTGDMGEDNAGSSDIMAFKLNSSGVLQWVTHLGDVTKAITGGDQTSGDDCNGAALDGDGNLYCGGSTGGAIAEGNGGGFDAFVLKFSPTGAVR